MQIRGRIGDLVFLPQADGRTVVRGVPKRLPPRTPLQRASEARLKRVAAAWQALTMEETEAWGWWAAPHGQKGYNAFSGLAAKRLQVSPDAPVPSLPPTTAFLGDGIVVTVSGPLPLGRGRGGIESVKRDRKQTEAQSTPTLPSPKGEAIDSTPSCAPQAKEFVRFSSSGPNSEGVLTELLVQKLAGKARKPTLRGYRTKGFVAFEAGALTAEVPCEKGAYALAIRFVRAATGQETATAPIGKVVVEG